EQLWNLLYQLRELLGDLLSMIHQLRNLLSNVRHGVELPKLAKCSRSAKPSLRRKRGYHSALSIRRDSLRPRARALKPKSRQLRTDSKSSGRGNELLREVAPGLRSPIRSISPIGLCKRFVHRYLLATLQLRSFHSARRTLQFVCRGCRNCRIQSNIFFNVEGQSSRTKEVRLASAHHSPTIVSPLLRGIATGVPL